MERECVVQTEFGRNAHIVTMSVRSDNMITFSFSRNL